MQNAYLEMMEATQRAISRANDISATAEKVIKMLGIHKDDLANMREAITNRFAEIRRTLEEDEKGFLHQIQQLTMELDSAIAALQGSEASAVEAPGAAAPEPVESAPEVSNAEG